MNVFTKEGVENAVRGAVQSTLGRSAAGEYSLELTLSDLGFDSLDEIEAVMSLEIDLNADRLDGVLSMITPQSTLIDVVNALIGYLKESPYHTFTEELPAEEADEPEEAPRVVVLGDVIFRGETYRLSLDLGTLNLSANGDQGTELRSSDFMYSSEGLPAPLVIARKRALEGGLLVEEPGPVEQGPEPALPEEPAPAEGTQSLGRLPSDTELVASHIYRNFVELIAQTQLQSPQALVMIRALLEQRCNFNSEEQQLANAFDMYLKDCIEGAD